MDNPEIRRTFNSRHPNEYLTDIHYPNETIIINDSTLLAKIYSRKKTLHSLILGVLLDSLRLVLGPRIQAIEERILPPQHEYYLLDDGEQIKFQKVSVN